MSYRLGCCIPGASFMPQTGGEGARALDSLRAGYRRITGLGYDFAEATVGTLTALDGQELEQARGEGMRFEVCNSFVPPAYAFAVTADDALYEFAKNAMRIMADMGTQYVILGSGAARAVPKELAAADKYKRLADFLRICSNLYGEYGVTTVLEPLNAKETNCVNNVSEGYALVAELALDGVMLLADAYHMHEQHEPVSVLSDCCAKLAHIHVSEPDRGAPGTGDDSWLEEFAAQLKKTAYNGRVSVECVFTPGGFERESACALGAVKRIFNDLT